MAARANLSGATAPTSTFGDSSTNVATTAFVGNATRGILPISTAGGTTTLTPAQASAPILLVTGTLTSAATVVVPNSGVYTVANRTTGTFSLTVTTAAGAGVAVAQGYTDYMIADGTNVVMGDNDLSGAVITGGTITSTAVAATTLAASSAVSFATALPITSGGTSATTAVAARSALGLATSNATLGFGGGAVVAAGTYVVEVPYAATVTSLKYEVGNAAGSFTLSVTNAGAAVTGLSSVAVSNATAATATATGGAAVAAGTRLAFVISAVAGSPTNAVLVLNWTRA